MRNSFLLVAALFCLAPTFPAQAEFYKYECYLVDAFDDWSVRIGDNQADFFDNNSNCILGLTAKKSPVFTYTSTDGCDADEEVALIFNQKELTAELKFPAGIEICGIMQTSLPMTCSAGTYQD